MGWLKSKLHPTTQSRADLERQAAEELERLTSDARSPYGADRDALDLDPDGPGPEQGRPTRAPRRGRR
jgi:hypothetical protein